MPILILFSFLAGLATIFAPCILPILPIVLSAGVTGGKQRPLGIVVGLVASFTFFTLSLSYLTKHLGLDANLLRNMAILVLLLFGIVLLIPRLLEKFEVIVSRWLPKHQPNTKKNDFLGGTIIGISLGLVWTPCVGPIVASVITLAATSTVSIASVLITAAYALGTSIPLLLITYGGQRLIKHVKSLSQLAPKLQIVFALIMIVTAGTMLLGLDQVIQGSLIAQLPGSISTGLTQQLENSELVQSQLKQLRGGIVSKVPTRSQIVEGASQVLPMLGKAPEFIGISSWLNSDPLTMAQLKGKVVLIDFWTYSCINCIRTLPNVTSWYTNYKEKGFVVIGVHAPEFAFEKDTRNVALAMKRFNIEYPVAQDNDLATWSAYENSYWPAEYLVDSQGNVRETHFGEGNYAKTEENIRALLLEANPQIQLPASLSSKQEFTQIGQISPETYLGNARRERFSTTTDDSKLPLNTWNLKGDWKGNDQQIISQASNSSLSFHFVGNDVYLVLNPPSSTASGTVQVMLDGTLIGSEAGADVDHGVVRVNTDRLYHLVHLSHLDNGHILTLNFQTVGTKAFSFTFG